MNRQWVVLVDNGHGIDTAGKCSPDKSLREWEYTRIIAKGIVNGLRKDGIDARLIVTEDKDISLSTRCDRVNAICAKYGRDNVILLSVHVDAAGGDGKWHDAGGFSVFTTKGTTKSDTLAECIYGVADSYLSDYKTFMAEGKKFGGYGTKQRPVRTEKSDGDSDFEANFTILYKTECAAVLSENMFQDNRLDVAWLLSEKGKQTLIDLHIAGIKRYLAL